MPVIITLTLRVPANGRTKIKASKMNDDESDDISFEKKHKKEDFDEDAPF